LRTTAQLLRLLRLGRVVRIFKALKNLQKIITATAASVLPVCNAFFILLIISSVYAVLGTNFFKTRAPEFFDDFLTSLFTMFQVLTGDGWAGDVVRPLFKDGKTEPGVAFFFLSYILIASVMMLNVVVAILLDEFIRCVTAEKDAELALLEEERDRKKLKGSLDAVSKNLIDFEDSMDLDAKINKMYSEFDEDLDGAVSFVEFRQGVSSLHNIHFTRDDFEALSGGVGVLHCSRSLLTL